MENPKTKIEYDKEWYKNYYQMNKDKIQANKARRVYCPLCDKHLRNDYFVKHSKTSLIHLNKANKIVMNDVD